MSKREHILDSALPLFLEHGYAGVSMSMVAATAGGSKGTLYAYFETKADLFIALMERTWEREGAEPPMAAAGRTRDEAHRWLTAWIVSFVSHLHSANIMALHRLIIAETGRFPELGRRIYAAGPARGVAQLRADLDVLRDNGILAGGDMEAAAHTLRALAKAGHYEAHLWGHAGAPDREAIATRAAETATLFLDLFGAEGSALVSSSIVHRAAS